MAESQARVRVLDRIRVSPSSPPPPSVEEELTLPLTFFDVAWLFTGPVERLFFFRHPDPASTLPLLRSSLSAALSRFYPLAGTIRPSSATDAPFVYSYSHGADGLSFVVAESEHTDDFDHLVSRDPRDLARIRPLVPQLPPPGADGAFALAAVQATVFPGRGICLGVSVHHAACDDASAMHFVHTWAAACRDPQSAMPPPPVLDRSLVADPDDLRGKTLAGMMRLAPPPPPPPPPSPQEEGDEELVMASFLLGRDQIDRIKDAAQASSFAAASALAWVCLLKAGSAGVVGPGAERSHMLFSAECRSRLAPPLPAEYFGNCLRPCFVEAATADILVSGDAGVAAAAAAIGRAVREMERGVLDGAEGWLARVMSVLPERPMSVGGSPRHGVYLGTDFGWGPPARVEMVSVEKTPGTVALAESPEGDGGMEIGVVLPRRAMDAFASCFAAHGRS